jgi:hypothetical protein
MPSEYLLLIWHYKTFALKQACSIFRLDAIKIVLAPKCVEALTL